MVIMWAWLGTSLGVIGTSSNQDLSLNEDKIATDAVKDLHDRMDVDSFTEEALSTQNWLQQLEKSIDGKTSFFPGTKDFLCCVVSNDKKSDAIDSLNSNGIKIPQNKKIRCHATPRLKQNRLEYPRKFYIRKIAKLKSITQAMKCGSEHLAYQLTIGDRNN